MERRPAWPPRLRMAPAAARPPEPAEPPVSLLPLRSPPSHHLPPLRSPRALPFSPLVSSSAPPSPMRTPTISSPKTPNLAYNPFRQHPQSQQRTYQQPITPTTSTIPASSPTISSFGSEETPHYNVERESRKLAALIQEGELVLFLERLGPALTRLEPNDRRALLAAGRARAKKAAERAYRRLASFPSHQQVPLGSPLTDDRKPPKPRTPRTPVRTPRSEARSRDPRTPLRGLRNSNNKNDNGIVKAKRGRNNGNIPLFSIGSSSGSPRK